MREIKGAEKGGGGENEERAEREEYRKIRGKRRSGEGGSIRAERREGGTRGEYTSREEEQRGRNRESGNIRGERRSREAGSLLAERREGGIGSRVSQIRF